MAILVILVYILVCVRHCLVQFPLIKSSQNLHNLALSGIVFTESVFFDKNPTGRMINRFSKDTTQMDENLINALGEIFMTIMLVLTTFMGIVIILPYILIALALLFVYLLLLYRYFIKTTRDLRRLDLISKSPTLTHLNNSIHGIATIRCLDLQDNFIEDMKEHIKHKYENKHFFSY